MRGSDHRETRAPRSRNAISHAQSFGVDANRYQFRTRVLERVAHEWVAGVLEPDLAVAMEQDVTNQAQCILVPVRNQDLPRRAGNAARTGDICGNGVSQGPKASGVRIGEVGWRELAGLMCYDA